MKKTLKKIGAVSLTLILMLSITACKNSESNKSGSKDSGTLVAENSSGSGTESKDTGNSIPGPSSEKQSSNILVAYFSLAGEQYKVGVIEEGNTSIIAHMIAEMSGADLFAIEAVTPYPQTHAELLDVSKKEKSENARPEIVGTVENMDAYDTVFIGYPNWWGDMPMIVYHFLESYDLSDKTIVPFCTHGGSGLSGTQSTIADITGGTMMSGFAISGETAQNNRNQSQKEVTAWLREGGFIE